MVFSSILFLFRFMPIAFAVYYLTPRKQKNLVLLILSLIFYSWGEVRYFPIMIASILVDYTASRGIESHRGDPKACKAFLLMSVFFNLGMLGFFKYTDFFIENINALLGTGIPLVGLTLPLGISFYTFQTMSYTIDVYRGKVTADQTRIVLGAFVVPSPKLLARQIVRYTDINRELRERKLDPGQINDGVKLFLFGLGSKVLIANNIGSLWTEVEQMGFAGISTPLAWLAILAYAFQIYFDFSGYSLMAIGLGKMLGFEFPKNFDFPYISRSMTEFWRRWHMTLGSWIREYLYFPLGGNRKGKARNILNLLIVWAATGFWHGADWNFIFWGLYFFVLLLIEKLFLLPVLEKHRWLAAAYLAFFLSLSWVIFAITDLSAMGVYFTRLFAFEGGADWIYYLRNYAVTFLLAGVLATPALKPVYQRLDRNRVLSVLFFGAIAFLSVAYLVDASYNPFLYFRF